MASTKNSGKGNGFTNFVEQAYIVTVLPVSYYTNEILYLDRFLVKLVLLS